MQCHVYFWTMQEWRGKRSMNVLPCTMTSNAQHANFVHSRNERWTFIEHCLTKCGKHNGGCNMCWYNPGPITCRNSKSATNGRQHTHLKCIGVVGSWWRLLVESRTNVQYESRIFGYCYRKIPTVFILQNIINPITMYESTWVVLLNIVHIHVHNVP